MATPTAEAHLAKLQSLRRKHMSTDRESAKEDLMHHQRQSSPPPFAYERKPGQRKSHVMKKRSRQQMTMQQQSRPPPPPPPCPRYVEVDDENDTSYNSSFATPTYEHAEVSFASSSYSSATTSSVSIDPHTSNIQRYRQYIQELSRGLEEEGEGRAEEEGEEELCAEELDVSDLMSLEQQNQSQRGSGHYNSKVKDNMIEEHYHLQESGDDLYSEESTYYDEEACLSSNNMQNYTSNSNFRVPAHVKLNLRANLYLLMVFTNIITISSIAVGTSASRRQHAALFFSTSSLVIAIALSFAFRYAPTRMYITQPYLFYEQYIGQVIDSREKAFSIVLLLCTFVVCGVVMNPAASLGVAPNYEVLNQSLFYSTWVSLYAGLIVVADLFTLDASRWIIARDCGGDCGLVPSAYRPSFQRRVLKKWVLVLFSNFAMSVALFDLYASGMCKSHCKNVMSGGIIALGGALIGIGVLALHHVVKKAQDRYQTYGTMISCWEGPYSQKKLNYFGTLLAIVVVVINCTAVGLVCTHLSGPGSAVLTCWVALIVSILVCKLYIGYFFVEKPQYFADDDKMNVCYDEESACVRSKGTRITELDESLEINDDNEEDNGHSFYEAESRDEMMDRLKTLSVSAHHIVEQEEEISEPNDVQIEQQTDPIKDSICSEDAEDCNTHISTARKITPSPPPPPPREPNSQSSEGNRNVTDEKERKQKPKRPPSKSSTTRSDGSVRLSGKDSAAIDDLVAKALLHATRTKEMAGQVQDASSDDNSHRHRHQNRVRSDGVVSDSEESRDSRKEQRRACRTELTDLIDKLGREKKEPPQYISHIFSDSSRSRSHSSSRSRRRSSSRSRSSSRRRSISID